jgi:hypothetical protein
MDASPRLVRGAYSGICACRWPLLTDEATRASLRTPSLFSQIILTDLPSDNPRGFNDAGRWSATSHGTPHVTAPMRSVRSTRRCCSRDLVIESPNLRHVFGGVPDRLMANSMIALDSAPVEE